MRKSPRPATLAAYLAAKRQTQYALATQLGISTAAMSKYVSGKAMPRPEMALKIHQVTGVPLESLLRARVAQQEVA